MEINYESESTFINGASTGIRCVRVMRGHAFFLKGGKEMYEPKIGYYKALFLISAIYDILLGVVFALFYRPVFAWLGISEALPQFGGYLTLIGAFLFVIGVAYYLIYRGDLAKNRDLILVGVLYKLAYCATAFAYFAIGQVPHVLFVAIFGVLDFIMFILMLECYLAVGKSIAAQAGK